MNTIATFDNTVSILVKAFLEGELTRGWCGACAVGNICAASIGVQVIGNTLWSGFNRPSWNQVFATTYGEQRTWAHRYEGEAKRQIDATGYTWEQLASIERAFELADGRRYGSAEFAGLMAVVDVLAEIHGVDLTAAEAAKSLFVRA